MIKAAVIPQAHGITSKDLIAEFKEDCLVRDMSPESIRRYISNIRIFAEYLEANGEDLLKVDKHILRSFLAHLQKDREVSKKSIKNYFTSISSLYDYLQYDGRVDGNPVRPFRKRYLQGYKNNIDSHMRKLISVDDMARLINATLDVRDKTIITLLAKTGIRRNELITLDVGSVDFVEQTIRLEEVAKRSNRTVFFDGETAILLQRWIKARQTRNKQNVNALFLNSRGSRIGKNEVYEAVTRPAKVIGLYNVNSDKMEDHFHPHCCRHWFTTELRKAGMPREFIQELRGDARKDAIDIYDHIDSNELRESYMACIPQLGV